VFFGSAVNNFGVMEVLDALVDLAPRRSRAPAHAMVNRQPVEKIVQPEDKPSPAWCSRCRPTWTPTHRDRIAFVRMASGKYTPGMKLKVQRTSKELRPTSW
jgi:peptide chain release factor 3